MSRMRRSAAWVRTGIVLLGLEVTSGGATAWAQELWLSPDVAEPGALVTLQGKPEWEGAKLQVGGKTIPIESGGRGKAVVFRVPDLPPGPVDIKVTNSKGSVAVVRLSIADRSHQELMLSLEDGKARVLSTVKRGMGSPARRPPWSTSDCLGGAEQGQRAGGQWPHSLPGRGGGLRTTIQCPVRRQTRHAAGGHEIAAGVPAHTGRAGRGTFAIV